MHTIDKLYKEKKYKELMLHGFLGTMHDANRFLKADFEDVVPLMYVRVEAVKLLVTVVNK